MTVSRRLPFALLALALAACAGAGTREPRMQIPYRTIADCESRSVKQTAIDSIVASTDDTIRAGMYPGDKRMMTIVKSPSGGVFAYWKDQPLNLPETAKALGVKGDYLMLRRAVITNQVNPDDHSRPIWLTFATPHGERTVLERAYDTQNVCIEGQREI